MPVAEKTRKKTSARDLETMDAKSIRKHFKENPLEASSIKKIKGQSREERLASVHGLDSNWTPEQLEELTKEKLTDAKFKLGIETEISNKSTKKMGDHTRENTVPTQTKEEIERIAIQEAGKRIEEDRNGKHGFFMRIWVRMAEKRYFKKYFDEAIAKNEFGHKESSRTSERDSESGDEIEVETQNPNQFLNKVKEIAGNVDYDKLVFQDDQKKTIEKMFYDFSKEDQEHFFSGDSKKENEWKLRRLTKAVLGDDPDKWVKFLKNKNVGAYGGAVALEFRSEDVLDSIGSVDADLAKEVKDLKKKIFERKAVDAFLSPTEMGGFIQSTEELRADNSKSPEQASREADEKFRELLRSKVKKIAVHGTTGFGNILKPVSDLDGEASLKLFELAGFTTKTKYVDKGAHGKGILNLDTGMYDGIDRDGDTYFLDHHGKESEKDSSACKYAWQFLDGLGFFEGKDEKETKAMARMVQFITEIDNCNYSKHDFKKVFENSYQNIIGYVKLIKLDRLLNWFMAPQNEARNPYDVLSPDELGYLMGIDKPNKLEKILSDRKEIVENTTADFEKMKEGGFIVNSKEYGKIFVGNGDFNLKAGVDAAIALDAGVYIYWNPPGFIISAISKELKPEHEVALDNLVNGEKKSAERIRRMYAKFTKNNGIQLRASIADILKILTDTEGGYTVSDDNGLKRLIINERKELKETGHLVKKK